MAGKGARNKTDAQGRNSLGLRRKSKVTGKPFTSFPPGVKKPGPKCKRDVYSEAIEWALQEYLVGEWVSSSLLADVANRKVSNYWTQLNGFSVGAIMRVYEKDGSVISRRHKGRKEWRWLNI